MVTEREAWVADKIRKFATFVLAAVATVMLLQVLFRLAKGRFRLEDPQLWIFLVLAVIGVVWIRATRRMPRTRDGAQDPAGSDE